MKFAKWLFLLNLIYLVFTHQAFSKVDISDIGLKTKSKEGELIISYSGKLLAYPEMEIKGNTIEITVPDAEVKKVIERNVSFATSNNDTHIKAYQLNKNTTRITTSLPFDMKGHKEQISMQILEGEIKLNLPKLKASKVVAKKAAPQKATPEVKKSLDKSYLDALLALEEKEAPKKEPRLILEDKKGEVTIAGDKTATAGADMVKTTQAATSKLSEVSNNSSFSIVNYAGKFVAFLGAILLLFYGIVTLMKKGVIKKGKLGFLHNADNVMVLSNTFVGPKKSLMLVKAHKQVFLVSSTDQGMQLISEVKDAAGLFKESEKSVAGTNFDVTLSEADENEVNTENVKLKEDITKSNAKASLSSYLEAKDRVKFSDQLKKKVKNLKPLQ